MRKYFVFNFNYKSVILFLFCFLFSKICIRNSEKKLKLNQKNIFKPNRLLYINGHKYIISFFCTHSLHKQLSMSFRVYMSHAFFPCVPTPFLHQIMSVQQLYRICTLYWDANYNTRSVSPDVSFFLIPRHIFSNNRENAW